jgi:hypothetical protein
MGRLTAHTLVLDARRPSSDRASDHASNRFAPAGRSRATPPVLDCLLGTLPSRLEGGYEDMVERKTPAPYVAGPTQTWLKVKQRYAHCRDLSRQPLPSAPK